MNRKAKMSDVAKLAGVGTMTVSRVVNDSALVTEETRKRVRLAIKRLNYQPNPVARSLRQARSNSIGIIVPNFYDPFFATCAHAISVVAKKRGYSVIVTTSDEQASIEFSEACRMVLHNVEGLAIIPAANGRSMLGRPELAATQIVCFDRPMKGECSGTVLVENESGSRCAVEHLIAHGHERVCFLGLSNKLYTMRVRHDGYERAMRSAGFTPQERFGCATPEETMTIVEELLRAPHAPTALFAANNLVMRHTLHALSRLHIRIPETIAIAGFDDLELGDIFAPALTVVRQPAQELGRVAAELLFTRLGSQAGSEAKEQIVLPVELVLRQSCGCHPVRETGQKQRTLAGSAAAHADGAARNGFAPAL